MEMKTQPHLNSFTLTQQECGIKQKRSLELSQQPTFLKNTKRAFAVHVVCFTYIPFIKFTFYLEVAVIN